MSPICLPEPNQDFSGTDVATAGWGLMTDNTKTKAANSPVLKYVDLKVSDTKYRYHKLFGTTYRKEGDQNHNPCAGDSGEEANHLTSAFTKTILFNYHRWSSYVHRLADSGGLLDR